VDETIEYEIQDEEVRRLGLKPTGEFETIQLIELPDAPVHVTEHLLVEYRDSKGNLYIPHCPELEGPIFGPRLLATIGWLKSVGHLSYSSIETWMEDVLQVPVSRGYLAKLRTGTISQSLEHAYDEAVEAIPHQNQLGSDETSIKENGKKHWIWCITATTNACGQPSQHAKSRIAASSHFYSNRLPPKSTGSLHLRYLAPRLVSVKISLVLVLSEAVLVLLLDRWIPSTSTSTIASD
jgi:hypothetical protein